MEKRVFTIAPGAPFLKTFAAALLEGRVVEGFSGRAGPFEMAEATIYVPTRRAARALADEFSRAINRSSVLLPRILPFGALEETETSLLFDEAGLDRIYETGFPEAMGEIARRMQLAGLILTWARALSHAIVSVSAQGEHAFDTHESFLVASTAADSWHLSGELANLIDELIIEGVAWEKLDPLVLPEFDRYWRITLDFLNIAIKQWPRILAERNLVDKARRQVALIEAQSRRLQDGTLTGPVVAIGSTGTNRATARLLGAIARAPKGAIVLPGLDLDLDDRAWAMIAGDPGQNIEASSTHPQATLSRLLGLLQVKRDVVVSLGEVAQSLAARSTFVSEALRPAESTDEWIDYRAGMNAPLRDAALQGVSLIEAADEREEALALAMAMRHVLETPCETAALVTPDRNLARRVRTELLRWGVDAEDSAGEPLSTSPIGALARLAIACAASKMEVADLAALLTHPLLRLGLSIEDVARRAALLETGLLRSASAAGCLAERIVGEPSALIAAARDEADSTFAHPAKKRISAEEWASLEDLLFRLGAQFAPLLNLRGELTLDRWAGAHRDTIEAIVGSEDEDVDREDREALDALFDELIQNVPDHMNFDVESYGLFFAAVAREIILRGAKRAHPRLQILGLLEARLIDVDVMLLGGLNETVWPPQARTDAFLNRPMRAALGLTPPERKLGQTAHDFAQAMGKGKVILSRARKRGGAPVVASRFLQRMAALGDAAWQACRERGDYYLRLARAIDRPAVVAAPSDRPLPRPPVELRPKRLSVTQIETLRRDPYALYAEKILRLKELDPLGGALGASEFGSAIHVALERFVDGHPVGPLPLDAREKLRALLREELAAQLQDADFAALKWPRLEKTIDFYLGFEARRRDRIKAIKTELKGNLDVPLDDGSIFTLTARADRIELNTDGTVTLVDYKTGTPPGPNEIFVGFAPQLTLEAAMCLRGAFDLGAAVTSAEAVYLKLGGLLGGEEKPLDFAKAKANVTKKSFLDLAEDHFYGLVELLDQFRDPATAYPPRPFPKFAKRYNAYDHLARVKEWSLGGEPEGGGS
ncbi:MAG: double-strand break repair protein AddB [Pseudomonadota bacterium]|nr:double-strand break repair protein AddB [Pseudomonadota bacterium]